MIGYESECKLGVERKFLVLDADLREADSIRLMDIEAVYLDFDKLARYGEEIGVIFNPTTEPREVRVSKRTVAKGLSEFCLTTKVGKNVLSRAEATAIIDEFTYYKIAKALGKSVVHKKRFKFDYLRKTFELDVFTGSSMMVLEVELEDENQLVALPPFVQISKEVTGQAAYYSSNLATSLKDN